MSYETFQVVSIPAFVLCVLGTASFARWPLLQLACAITGLGLAVFLTLLLGQFI